MSQRICKSLLEDETFLEVAREATFDNEYPENAEMYCGDGIDLEELAVAVHLIRRAIGKKSGFVIDKLSDRPSDEKSYFVITASIEERLESIEHKATLQPFASAEALKNIRRNQFMHSVFEDLSAGLTRDGLQMDSLSVQSLIFRRAGDAEEALTLRAFELAAYYIEQGAVEEILKNPLVLYRELVQSDQGLPYNPLLRPPNVYPLQGKEHIQPNFESVFSFKGLTVSEALLRCIEASDTIWELNPFPKWNGLMEWVLRMLYCTSLGLSLLGYVPFSKMMLEWEHGMLAPPKVMFGFGRGTIRNEFGTDSTLYYHQLLTFLDEGLDKILADAKASQSRLDAVRGELQSSYWLNHRQITMIDKWLIGGAEDSISVNDYSERFSVTTNTARNDLQQLMTQGFCFMRYEGKRQVYQSSSNLIEVLSGNLAQYSKITHKKG